ncbi:TonB-dependent receptor plug domain-containing protein [Acetobacter sacchari]|uniref:TonB-dependent receptor plug domain-containing protein n=1 Tax=Acetobacter sacchari TaxID=2661687 RepID=A0ABS3M0J8_9PROT|nr:TonB-dependent receptor [Acetobacter sacchari]MBO1361686.1 TonB-dependent receptor plug domain-containing protein [Acetobacter sacchari]
MTDKYLKTSRSFFRRRLLFSCIIVPCCLAVVDGDAFAGISTKIRPHHKAELPTTAAAQRSRPARVSKFVSQSKAEEFSVRAPRHNAGGGLLVKQSAPVSVSEVSRAYISKQIPTISPTQLIASLPGVQAGNEGPINTETETMHIRGLDQSQIGFLFEGVPVSDAFSYAPWATSMVDNENLASIKVTQGSVDLTAPLYNADGAMVSMQEIRPTDEFGGYIDLSGGTHSLQKQFLRLNTGEIGHSDVRAFASFSHSGANVWRGPGKIERYHVDANVEKQWAPGSSTDIIFGYTRSHQNIYRTSNLAQWKNYGTSFNYNGIYTAGDTNYYKLNERFTNVLFSAMHNDFKLSDALTLHIEPYTTFQKGPNNYGSTIPVAGGYLGTEKYGALDGYQGQSGKVTVESVHPWRQNTSGLTTNLDWKAGHNTLSLFYWYSYGNHTEYQHQYALSPSGAWSYGDRYLTVNGVPITGYQENTVQQVNAIGLDDSVSLLGDKLLIDVGFKVSMASVSATENLPGSVPYKAGKSYFEPTPQLLASYYITKKDQIYLNATTSYRLPSGWSPYVPQFSMTSATPSSTPSKNLGAEYFIGQEVGYRHNGPINVSASWFHYNLTNHQISSSSYLPGTSVLISTQIAAGGEEAWGFQGEVGTRPWRHLSAYASGQFLHTRLGNDVDAGTDYLTTKGKRDPGAPKWSGAVGLTYDDGIYFGNFNIRYQGSQYSTLMNDQKIPGYVTADLNIGRSLPSFNTRLHPKIMVNLVNMGGVNYLSSISGFGLTAVKQKGIFGNTVNASTPSYIVGSAFTAVLTISSDF